MNHFSYSQHVFQHVLFVGAVRAVLLWLTLASPLLADESPILMFSSSPLEHSVYGDRPEGEEKLMADGLYRELGRQAILLTAREEFGLATRDDALLEPIDQKSIHTFDVKADAHYHKHLLVTVSHQNEEIFSHKIETHISAIEAYHVIAKQIEPITRAELIDVFEKAGYQPKPSKKIDPKIYTPIDYEIEEQLLTMHHLAQFRAIRELHRLIREEGESVERLAALVRGYANLSQLMLSTMDVRSQVFAARAMLYAERMESLAPKTPIVSWTKFYLNTLIGFPTPALKALEEARARRENQLTDRPEWIDLLENFCYYLVDELESTAANAESPHRELAALLMFRTSLQTTSKTLLTETGNRVLKIIPHCLWISDAMTLEAGVGHGHTLTALAPRAHTYQVTNYLPAWQELPASVQKIVGESKGSVDMFARARIARELIKESAAEVSEPSYAVLGRNIEAWNVLQVVRRGLFVKESLGLEASKLIQHVEEVIAEHPDAALIRTLGARPGASVKEYEPLVKNYRPKESNYYSTHEILHQLPKNLAFANMTAREANAIAYNSAAYGEQRYVRKLRGMKGQAAIQSARWMESTSEHAPIRFAKFLRYDWKENKQHLEVWLKRYGQHPVIALAAAQGYAMEGELEEAIPLFNRYLDAAPDYNVFMQLANLYYKTNDDKMWLETMERVFEHEDYSLDHSNAAARLADTLMHQGDFEAALPWAERAEKSGSSRGMRVLCDCLTGLEKFKEAEQLAYQHTMRYGMNGGYDPWYDWCAENGRGQLDDAWKLKQQRLNLRTPADSRERVVANSLQQLVTSQLEAARDTLAERLVKKFSPWDSMTLAILYDELDQPQLRDQMFQKLIAHDPGDTKPPVYCLAAPVFVDFIESGDFDDDRLLSILQDASVSDPKSWRKSVDYFVGVMFEKRGNTEEAIKRWTGGAGFSNSGWTRILTWQRLRRAGVDPIHLEGRYFRSQFHRE